MEFELALLQTEPVETIKEKINESAALFILLGPGLISQPTPHTSNWVAAEAGLAFGLGKDVWVFEDWLNPVLYPVPFAHFYNRIQLQSSRHIRSVRNIILRYDKDMGTRITAAPKRNFQCSQQNCQAHFSSFNPPEAINRCPVCTVSQTWNSPR